MEQEVYSDSIIDRISSITSDNGIRLELGTDFDDFAKICASEELRPKIKPPFDVDDPSASAIHGFWLAGYDDFEGKERLVHTQSMKVIDLGGETLHKYTSRNRTIFPLECSRYDTENIEVAMTRESDQMNGRVGYHGELWAIGGEFGLRGTCIVPLLSRLVIRLGIHYLDPEHIIGFMEPKNILRGLAARLGYAHAEQGNLIFPLANKHDAFDVWMVWMSAEEANFNTSVQPDFFADLYGHRKQQGSASLINAA